MIPIDCDELHLGPTPAEEACEQVGPNYDPARARKECREFINQIRRQLGEEPEGAQLKITLNTHDFGTYRDVVVRYDVNDQKAREYAWRCENETPMEWDEVARRALGLPD
jgi:hypothetical protein